MRVHVVCTISTALYWYCT